MKAENQQFDGKVGIKAINTGGVIQLTKSRVIVVLYILVSAIILSGAAFIVYSIIEEVKFRVLNTDIGGYVFGLVAIFLGVRYIKALFRLRRTLRDTNARFSWHNFHINPKKVN